MRVFYMTDMHLDYRIAEALDGCKPKDASGIAGRIIVKYADLMFQGRKFTKDDVLLLGGDVSPWKKVNEWFYTLTAQRFPGHIIAVLGNHDIWGFETLCFEATAYPVDKVIAEQVKCAECEQILKAKGDFVLLQNEIAFLPEGGRYLNVLSEDTVCEDSEDELLEQVGNSPFIVVGGLGFSGYNARFNASNGIYKNTLRSFRGDRILSDAFYEVYRKAASALPDRPVICLTHNPMIDWTNKASFLPDWYYVSGHTHKNVRDDKKGYRHYADRQVGYTGWNIGMKMFEIE